eukprot:76225_1
MHIVLCIRYWIDHQYINSFPGSLSDVTLYIYSLFKSVEHTNISKHTHCVAILYFVSNIITLICMAFIRSTVWTNIPVHKFTQTQCEIGFYGTYTFWLIDKTLMSVLFLLRIKILFQNSMYQYSPTTLNVLMGFIVFTFIGELTFLYVLGMEATHWILHYNDNGVVYCKGDDDYHPVALVGKAYVAISDQIFCFIFIYMFASKLRLLQKQLVIRYLTDHPMKYMEKAQSLSTAKHKNKSKSVNVPYVPSKE